MSAIVIVNAEYAAKLHLFAQFATHCVQVYTILEFWRMEFVNNVDFPTWGFYV